MRELLAALLLLTALNLAAGAAELPRVPPADDDLDPVAAGEVELRPRPVPPPVPAARPAPVSVQPPSAAPTDGGAVLPPPPDEEAAQPPRRPRRRGNDVWRAYSSLSEAERNRMNELQAKDPDAFRQEMQKIAEAHRQAELERRKKLDALLVFYRDGSEAEREMVANKIAAMVRDDYNRKLEDHRRHTAEIKKRVASLEQDLANRENNAEAIIKALVADLLEKALAAPASSQ